MSACNQCLEIPCTCMDAAPEPAPPAGVALTLETVRLALASVFGRGAEARDVVQLAADVIGEVQHLRGEVTRLRETATEDIARTEDVNARLRAKLAESEERRVTARRESDALLARLHDVTALRAVLDAESRHPSRWKTLTETSPSGKTMFRCEECGVVTTAPNKVCGGPECGGHG